jgi:hypothetical protein
LWSTVIPVKESEQPKSQSLALRIGRLQEFKQFFWTNVGVTQDAFQDFRVKYFRGVEGYCDALARCILVNHVASALSRQGKS